MFTLQNKIAVITGGGSGIGEAICLLFAKQGATVYILDQNEVAGNKVQEAITIHGYNGYFIHCNIAIQNEVDKKIHSVLQKENRIDILINNAGIAHIGTAETTEENDFDRLMLVNVKGAYNCMHAVLPAMKLTGGVILNMTSVVSSVGIPERFAYATTKGALLAMTFSVAKDFIGYNIRCNCISPARVHTPFVDGYIQKNYPGREKEIFEKLSKTQPIGRMAKPADVASLALYLSSDEASFITGCDYPVDGGFIKLNN